MSEYDRSTGVIRFPVRGFKAVRFSVILKALGLFWSAVVIAAILIWNPEKTILTAAIASGLTVSKNGFELHSAFWFVC